MNFLLEGFLKQIGRDIEKQLKSEENKMEKNKFVEAFELSKLKILTCDGIKHAPINIFDADAPLDKFNLVVTFLNKEGIVYSYCFDKDGNGTRDEKLIIEKEKKVVWRAFSKSSDGTIYSHVGSDNFKTQEEGMLALSKECLFKNPCFLAKVEWEE